MAVISLQFQEVMSSVEKRSIVVGTDLEEVNDHFDCHWREINQLKKEEESRDLIVGAAHKAELSKTHLDRMEDRACKCGHTPSKVVEELSSKEGGRTELSYASSRASEYIAPPVKNSIPIPIPTPCHPCRLSVTCPALEEIVEEPRDAICDNLDVLLREVEVEGVRKKGSLRTSQKKENIEGNCERNMRKPKFKEKHNCNKSNFLILHE